MAGAVASDGGFGIVPVKADNISPDAVRQPRLLIERIRFQVGVGLLVLFVVQSGLTWFRHYTMSWLGERAVADMRRKVFDSLLLQDARRQLQLQAFDLLVLDVGLPDGSGLDLLRELRHAPTGLRTAAQTPVLMLSAQGEEIDRVLGLELGADDYLSKPFEARELLARVKALLRRASPEPVADEVLRFGRLEIDLGARQARIDGKPAA